ncbi:MAG TPA: hypothetical protein VN653_03725, partial [Anaerolineales bacterium]|nr:hypothetical protein [Anaerolineales bacterium]
SNMELASAGNKLTIETDYPWDGRVKISVAESPETSWSLSLRMPGWSRNSSFKVNGQDVNSNSQKGYMTMERLWKAGDTVEIDFAMSPFLVEANPRVDSVRGCVAIQRGPLVYCLEEHDQEQEVNLLDMKIDISEQLTGRWNGEVLGGVMMIEGTGYQQDRSHWPEQELYRPLILENQDRNSARKVKLAAIPYFAWGNRGLKSMRVWIPYIRS